VHSTSQGGDAGHRLPARNRKENGIIKDMNILENGSIVSLATAGPLRLHQPPAPEPAIRRAGESLHIKFRRKTDLITTCRAATSKRWCWAKWLSTQPKVYDSG
jgi:ribose transport system ATP-binding protein